MKVKLVYGDERAPPLTVEVNRQPRPGEDLVLAGGDIAEVTKVVCTPGETYDAVVAIRRIPMRGQS